MTSNIRKNPRKPDVYCVELTAAELDDIRAGLGALRKKITDRIKNNEKNIDRPGSSRHLEYNRRRLERIDALLDIMIKNER